MPFNRELSGYNKYSKSLGHIPGSIQERSKLASEGWANLSPQSKTNWKNKEVTINKKKAFKEGFSQICKILEQLKDLNIEGAFILFDMEEAYTKPPKSYSTEKLSLYWEMLLTEHANHMKDSIIKFPHNEEYVLDCVEQFSKTFEPRADLNLNDKDLDSRLRALIRSTFRKQLPRVTFSYKKVDRPDGFIIEGTPLFRDPKNLTKSEKLILFEDLMEKKVKFMPYSSEEMSRNGLDNFVSILPDVNAPNNYVSIRPNVDDIDAPPFDNLDMNFSETSGDTSNDSSQENQESSYDQLLASIQLTNQNKQKAGTYATLLNAAAKKAYERHLKLTPKEFIKFCRQEFIGLDGPDQVTDKKLINWFNNTYKKRKIQ